MNPANIATLFESHADAMVDDLKDWLRIPSVSSDSSRTADVDRAANWLLEKFQSSGLTCEKISTQGHPIVLAETPPVENAPVVMVYGHYDVQPEPPLELWDSPPFEPEIRDGNIYARGATDDKGQLLTHIQSVTRLLAAGEQLPIQVKFLIEGEEEVGSQQLEQYLPSLRDRCACDCIVVSDSSQYADGQPAITYGLRGICTYEMVVSGPDRDLHSGSFGGSVMNPGIALSKILAAMVDAEGRIQIPGFYDDVVAMKDVERQSFAALPGDDASFADSLGVQQLHGEAGYTSLERRWARPTFDVNGITCGHQGEGVKTIVPAKASAKFSFRIVAIQDPEKITAGIQAFLDVNTPPGVTVQLLPDHGAGAMLANVESPFVAAAKQAIQHAFGVAPVMIREGGSIPILGDMQRELDADCLLLGWGLDDDNLHSPNEKFRLADYQRGTVASANLWYAIGNA
ncbi:MAG: dipeptidase [Planctomycetota bacterium]